MQDSKLEAPRALLWAAENKTLKTAQKALRYTNTARKDLLYNATCIASPNDNTKSLNPLLKRIQLTELRLDRINRGSPLSLAIQSSNCSDLMLEILLEDARVAISAFRNNLFFMLSSKHLLHFLEYWLRHHYPLTVLGLDDELPLIAAIKWEILRRLICWLREES